MKLEGTIYCEAPGCPHHAHVGADTMAAERLPVGFLRVVAYTNGRDDELAFCCIDCVMKWAAQFEPPTVIPWDDIREGDEDE